MRIHHSETVRRASQLVTYVRVGVGACERERERGGKRGEEPSTGLFRSNEECRFAPPKLWAKVLVIYPPMGEMDETARRLPSDG